VLRAIRGAADVKVEQTRAAVMNVEIDRAAIARYGLSVADVQDVVAARRRARGRQVFEGDRRFDLVVRLPDELRRDVDALESLPVPLPHGRRRPELGDALALGGPRRRRRRLPPARSRRAIGSPRAQPDQPRERQAPRRRAGNVRGRDLGSFVREAQAQSRASSSAAAAGSTGAAVREPGRGARAPRVVVPLCFLLIFLALTARSARCATRCSCSAACRSAHRRRARAVAARHALLDLRRGRFIALSGVAVLERPRHGQLHRRSCGATASDFETRSSGQPDAAASGHDDRSLVASLGFCRWRSPPEPARRCNGRWRPSSSAGWCRARC
jgi:cobalt-zinc-cadmium resistance protein CzcA